MCFKLSCVRKNEKEVLDELENSLFSYQYDPLELLEKESINTNELEYSLNYQKDYLLRTDSIAYKDQQDNDILTVNYSYKEVGQDKTTNVITKYENQVGSNVDGYSYQYDGNGNIIEVRNYHKYVATEYSGSIIAKANITAPSTSLYKYIYYHYDQYNQLIREDNKILNKTITYEYDLLGNIVSKKIYSYTTDEDIDEDTLISSNTYLYQDSNDKTKLTSVNGETIVYNSDGLIEDYYGERQLSWEDGKLSQVSIDEDEHYCYQYDVQGNRISKYDSFNEITTRYIYDDDSNLKVELRYQTYDDEQYLLDKIIYEYDSNDSPISFVYESYDEEGEIDYKYRCYYLKNISGDIISISDEDHNIICKYSYDSYGNCTVTYDTDGFTADSNHLRYRGYYQDDETGFYYLSSRYYDSNIGRFITKDEIEYLGVDATTVSYNLYVYCLNNPVNNSDSSGNLTIPNWAKVVIGVGTIVGLTVATTVTGGVAGVILGAALNGAVYGGIGGAVIGGVSGAISNGASGIVSGVCSGFMNGVIFGAVSSALLSASSITCGGVKVIGNAQKTGTLFHRAASNVEAGKMSMQFWKYNKITLNRCLNTAGLNGRKMPDVIGVLNNGKALLIEVLSKSQTDAQLMSKLNQIIKDNGGSKLIDYSIVHWAQLISKIFKH